MNRRNFLSAAIAAALAPTAFAQATPGLYDAIAIKPTGPILQPATFHRWRNSAALGFSLDDPALLAEMERLWKACVAEGPGPDMIWCDDETFSAVRRLGYET